MDISSLSKEDSILLAIEYVSKGLNIPKEIQDDLGPELIRDINEAREDHAESNGTTNIVGESSLSTKANWVLQTKQFHGYEYSIRYGVRTSQGGPT